MQIRGWRIRRTNNRTDYCNDLNRSSLKHLLDQDKGYHVVIVDLLLVEARKFEAMAAGRETLQNLKSTRHMVTDEIRQRQLCRKCAPTHQPRRCPAYRDICNVCNERETGQSVAERNIDRKQTTNQEETEGQSTCQKTEADVAGNHRSQYTKCPAMALKNEADDRASQSEAHTKSFM